MSKGAAKGSNIQVCVRVRPLVRREKENSEQVYWDWDKRTIKSPDGEKDYTFDHLFTTEHTTDDIYKDVVSEIVANTMLGYHGSVFSYGQTASGKTFTMNGTAKQPGIIPIAIFDAFDAVEKFPDRIFLFRVTYLEVYKEQVKDLLNPDPTSNANIKIQFDDTTKTAVVRGVKEQVVMNAVQVMSLLQSGEMYRHVGATDMNEKSSRAHTVFRLIIESKDANGGARSPIRSSTLNLIDLAGSENARMTNSTGDRALEAKAINQSLLTLSVIIQRLSEMKGDKSTLHLPYRDSKLTRILQEPLSGNALVAIICTISPSAKCAEESANTMRFASRAKKVSLSASVNEGEGNMLIRQYEQEIQNLRAKILQMEADATSSMGARNGVTQEQIEEDLIEEREDRDNVLRMIEEMNRYILKADGSIAEEREKNILDKVISKWKKKTISSKRLASGDAADDDAGGVGGLTGAIQELRSAADRDGGNRLSLRLEGMHVGSSDAFEAATKNKSPNEILLSVAGMLEMLKEKVDKKPVRRTSTYGGGPEAVNDVAPLSIELEGLRLELKIKTADAVFLEQEVARKDAMLQQLVQGLSDVESMHQTWEDELNAVKDLLETEKEDNAYLREKIADYLKQSDGAAGGGYDGPVADEEVKELRRMLLLEKSEGDNLRDKINELSEDRANWRHKYMLLSAQNPDLSFG